MSEARAQPWPMPGGPRATAAAVHAEINVPPAEKTRSDFAVQERISEAESLRDCYNMKTASNQGHYSDVSDSIGKWAELLIDLAFTVGDLRKSDPISDIASEQKPQGQLIGALQIFVWSVKQASQAHDYNIQRLLK